MATKTWNAGDVLTAADMNAWTVPLAAYRTTTQSVTSSTTLVNDNALFFTVAANCFYRVELVAAYDAATAGDFKFAFTVPAAAVITMVYASFYTGGAAVTTDDQIVSEVSLPIAGGLGAGTACAVHAVYFLNMGANSGTLQFQWAQGTSSATATIIHGGSSLIAQRIG